MFTPMAVNVLQQHRSHERRELLNTDGVEFFFKMMIGCIDHRFDDIFIGDGLCFLNLLGKLG